MSGKTFQLPPRGFYIGNEVSIPNDKPRIQKTLVN